ncbi:MAG: beta-lactamase family protein [Clostridia bacterium]|nr:beta-lactamase family protein [Clostridia bacterium]
MRYCTPEEAGISSLQVKRFFERLESYRVSAHSVILSRGDAIFAEGYYAPFHKDFQHRMYSTSKTFVSIAIGFCEQDGLLSLDDPIEKFFPEYVSREGAIHHSSTVRELLMMKTTIPGFNWFRPDVTDRTATYFEKSPVKLPNTLFDYDSCGSYMLNVIVERVTGKPFVEYLHEKFLDDIGFTKEAYCLKAAGGYSWGDSGVMCTTRDLLRFGRFLLNKGTFHGKRYLNEQYMNDATNTRGCSGGAFGFFGTSYWGYGYQIWGSPYGCFSTYGMGGQLAICNPKYDFVMAINADTQGDSHGYVWIFEALEREILSHLDESAAPLPADPAANAELQAYLGGLKLLCLPGKGESDFSAEINGVTFKAEENPMGIKWFRLELDGDEGKLRYENAQGVKCMPFGFGHNVFDQFPEEGYSDEVGNEVVPGNTYRAAFSADWPDVRELRIRVQVIDKYFGNLGMIFAFRDGKSVCVRMEKRAENFLDEYKGTMIAFAE